MFTTIAVLPHPPLLVPQLATGAAAETEVLRAACLAATGLLGAAAGRWVAVGADEGGRRTVGSSARGTFAGFGVDVPVALDTCPACSSPPSADPVPSDSPPLDPAMALPLLIAGWAAAAAGVAVVIRGELVTPDSSPRACAALGAWLAGEGSGSGGERGGPVDPEPTGLLVLGDGAATHTEKAPRHLDVRAGPFDQAVADALARADPAGLAALDPVLADELGAIGRAPWQVLAGAAAGARWQGRLLYSDAPFGVAYHVAVWTRCP